LTKPGYGVPPQAIETKYTLLGDANLDGVVNGDDFATLTGTRLTPSSPSTNHVAPIFTVGFAFRMR
jgi:hypothetical protein